MLIQTEKIKLLSTTWKQWTNYFPSILYSYNNTTDDVYRTVITARQI